MTDRLVKFPLTTSAHKTEHSTPYSPRCLIKIITASRNNNKEYSVPFPFPIQPFNIKNVMTITTISAHLDTNYNIV